MFMTRWYAARTQPRHEKTALRHLQVRNVESFLPLYKSVRHWRNRTTPTLELPLFPGFIFVHLKLIDRVRVLSVPGILDVVCDGTRPSTVCDRKIDALRKIVVHPSVEPHPFSNFGTRVRVTTGPLAGIEGHLFTNADIKRVVIPIDIIMQAASVEVAEANVEPIEDVNGQGVPISEQLLADVNTSGAQNQDYERKIK